MGAAVCTTRVFRQTFTIDDAIGLHVLLLHLKRNHACDQCHLSRVFILLTGWHYKLRPNTEGPWTCGRQHTQDAHITVSVGTVLFPLYQPAWLP